MLERPIGLAAGPWILAALLMVSPLSAAGAEEPSGGESAIAPAPAPPAETGKQTERRGRPARSPSGEFAITEEDRAFWAFQPPVKAPLPAVRRREWVANPIDHFILAGLEARGLEPNPPATRRELIRRAAFDLTGLPPAPEEVEAFLQDAAPGAYERLIDRLLASPRYGERWGRHWLDVVRFAQTNGYERDDEKPEAWRYRDYVVRAFNSDLPYDRFIAEQLAGDELEDGNLDALIATGFYRLGVWDDEPDEKKMAEYDELDEIISVTGAAFLGLSLGCARCHDHMFDPIPQEDYYRLLAIFHNIRPYDKPAYTLDSPTLSPLAAEEEIERWRDSQRQEAARIEEAVRSLDPGAQAEKERLEKELERVRKAAPPFSWALAIRERGPEPGRTRVLERGDAAQEGREVDPEVPQVFTGRLPASPPQARSTGRRRALAEWITRPDNPLAARVLVNRVWMHHLGRGIVRTPDDFGRAGTEPTHPGLLDWLARDFAGGGWKIKPLHRLIMTSSAYRMSSRADNPAAAEIDPANDLFWRQNMKRLEAEAIRDAILAASGRLDLTLGGRGFFPELDREVIAGASRPGRGWELSSPAERDRRSIYIFIKRTMGVPFLEMFDYANTDQPLGERPATTVAPQALLLLNGNFLTEQAEAFARRLRAEAGGGPAALIERAFQLALSRPPGEREARLAMEFYDRQLAAFRQTRRPLVFRPRVPEALYAGYLNRLPETGFLSGPERGWRYFRGEWLDRGEEIYWADPDRGPFALWDEPGRFADGAVRARLLLQSQSEPAGLIARARPRGTAFSGYEVLLDPEKQAVALRRHDAAVVELGRAAFPIRAEAWIDLVLELEGARLRLRPGAGEPPLIEATDPEPLLEPGHAGVRISGAPLQVEALSVAAAGSAGAIADAAAASRQDEDAEGEALRELCAMLFNLNEFIYID